MSNRFLLGWRSASIVVATRDFFRATSATASFGTTVVVFISIIDCSIVSRRWRRAEEKVNTNHLHFKTQIKSSNSVPPTILSLQCPFFIYCVDPFLQIVQFLSDLYETQVKFTTEMIGQTSIVVMNAQIRRAHFADA